jgi:hypothetical protein
MFLAALDATLRQYLVACLLSQGTDHRMICAFFHRDCSLSRKSVVVAREQLDGQGDSLLRNQVSQDWNWINFLENGKEIGVRKWKKLDKNEKWEK